MACIYILRSQITLKNYIGSSHLDDPKERIRRHNSGLVRSTKHGVPWELIHVEVLDNYITARKRELFLKSGKGREWIKSNF
ncbi:MAG: GIY-YIG nuclease family protein [Bacteroidia bacterium]|nr:GIY-YIG nuclease family protein [Bacteroidia bacterium]